jgi:hypothetical protein
MGLDKEWVANIVAQVGNYGAPRRDRFVCAQYRPDAGTRPPP